jgi:hypothetical protein
VPADLEEKVRASATPQIELYAERVLSAARIEDVFDMEPEQGTRPR